jgi:ribosome biogenesis GTPase
VLEIDFSQCYEPTLHLKLRQYRRQASKGNTRRLLQKCDLSFDARIIVPWNQRFGIVDMEKEEISGYFQSSLN